MMRFGGNASCSRWLSIQEREASDLVRRQYAAGPKQRAGDDELLGGVTLGNLRRGVAQCATLGYWMGEKHAGHGFMGKAVRALLRHVFVDMRLHRVEAACAPNNERSRRLLEKLGFHREGFARAYLLIDGAWQDHLLFAILESDFLREEPTYDAMSRQT